MDFVKEKTSQLSSVLEPSVAIQKVVLMGLSIVLGQWVLSDLIHIPGGVIGVTAFGVAIWLFFKSDKTSFDSPSTVRGWIQRCNEVLEQFENLEQDENLLSTRQNRISLLQKITERSIPQKISFASTNDVAIPSKNIVANALNASTEALDLSWKTSLSIRDDSWILPQEFVEQDLLVYVLPLPLRAADLLWLEKIPADQPSWVMVAWKDSSTWIEQLKDLQAQLPDRWNSRVLRWSDSDEDMSVVLNPVRRVLNNSTKNIDLTKQRLLSRLHSSWQIDLEKLRRDKYRTIQNRSQWIVAGAVFASPVPSTDLLSVAVVNGLMIKEMSSLWSCKIKSELLHVVARQLACAAIAQGVVEWSGQTLLGVAKLHGGGWLAAGSMQALSAAYLTRVVGASMADWMAINNGVLEPDLELLKQQAPQLVAKAAEKERVDWLGFLNQCKDWVNHQINDSNKNSKILEV